MESDLSSPLGMQQKEPESEQEELKNSTLTKQMDTTEGSGSIHENCKTGKLKGDDGSKESGDSTLSQQNSCRVVNNDSSSQNLNDGSSSSMKESFGYKDNNVKLKIVVESLIDFCVRVVRCSPDLYAVFTALNECHVHEVELFFRAVRSREPVLVGQLQEQLLDTGSHNRLVTILSDMYT